MITVVKANGEKEPFSEEKVFRSIQRAGIPKELQIQVIEHVKSKLYPDIPTSLVFHHIVEFLGKSPHPFSKARYSLKQSIMELGPTGYPFEDFIAEVLKAKGYITQTRTFVKGSCVQHEIDVIAHKEMYPTEETTIIETKFHNNPGIKTDIHVALYTKARFDDIKTRHGFGSIWLVTNTKVTSDVITYGMCVGMKIISWSYPIGESLRDIIESLGLFPITALSSLSQAQKVELLNSHIVLCKTISQVPSTLDKLRLSAEKYKEVLTEAKLLSNTSHYSELKKSFTHPLAFIKAL